MTFKFLEHTNIPLLIANGACRLIGKRSRRTLMPRGEYDRQTWNGRQQLKLRGLFLELLTLRLDKFSPYKHTSLCNEMSLKFIKPGKARSYRIILFQRFTCQCITRYSILNIVSFCCIESTDDWNSSLEWKESYRCKFRMIYSIISFLSISVHIARGIDYFYSYLFKVWTIEILILLLPIATAASSYVFRRYKT